MSVIGALLLGLWLVAIPCFIGGIFTSVDKQAGKLPFRWISGQLCLWAGFQLICEPFVLLQKDFPGVKLLFLVYQAVLVLVSLFCMGRRKRRTSTVQTETVRAKSKKELWAWGVFAVLLLVQLVLAVCMTYADIDDAYYVGQSVSTWDDGNLYRKIPYTGQASGLNLRHGLAPFPVWITFLAVMSGVHPAIVAHVAVPLVFISATYGLFYLLGEHFFTEKRQMLPIFLIFTELLVLFGDYSMYTAEKFMIARSRQGKAALGSIVIPALFLLFLILLEKLQAKERIPAGLFVLIGAALITSCLCSALGGLLVCILTGVTGLCGAVCYRRWKFLIPLALGCVPCGLFALLYVLYR